MLEKLINDYYLSTFRMAKSNTQKIGIKVEKSGPRRFYLLRDLWSFMKERKKWWLLPIVIMLILVGILIVVGQSSALSPFIYAFF